MAKPRVIIFSGYGLNTEDETKFTFESVGAQADVIHINDLIKSPQELKKAQIVVFPGGFSYGDHTGSGKAYANRVRRHLFEPLQKFLERDTLMLGICNGFQILTNAGLLPGALIANDNARYTCRWVDLEVQNDGPWLRGITRMSVPIAHGEGKYYSSEEGLHALTREGGVALTYISGETAEHFDLPYNPNGSLDDIAGITAHSGRVLGMMPHPERAISFTQLPHWTYLKERYARNGADAPKEGGGLQIFRNAVHYFS